MSAERGTQVLAGSAQPWPRRASPPCAASCAASARTSGIKLVHLAPNADIQGADYHEIDQAPMARTVLYFDPALDITDAFVLSTSMSNWAAQAAKSDAAAPKGPDACAPAAPTGHRGLSRSGWTVAMTAPALPPLRRSPCGSWSLCSLAPCCSPVSPAARTPPRRMATGPAHRGAAPDRRAAQGLQDVHRRHRRVKKERDEGQTQIDTLQKRMQELDSKQQVLNWRHCDLFASYQLELSSSRSR